MDGASLQMGARVDLQLKALIGERVEQAIRLDFPMSNNETEYEAILTGIVIVQSVSSEKLLICSDSQLVVGQVNGEYETRDQHMTKYVKPEKNRFFLKNGKTTKITSTVVTPPRIPVRPDWWIRT